MGKNITQTDEACVLDAIPKIDTRKSVTVLAQIECRYSFNVWVGTFREWSIGPYIYKGSLTSVQYLEVKRELMKKMKDHMLS